MVRASVLGAWRLPITLLALFAVLAAGVGFGLGLRAAFANSSASGVLYACQGERSGSVRIVPAGTPCLRGEKLISWNIQGPAGPVGPAGPQGPSGPAGTGGLSWKGAWSAATGYVTNDAVEFEGSAYIAVAANQNQMPGSSAAWQLLAQGGQAGQRTIAGYVAADGSIISGSGFDVELLEEVIDEELSLYAYLVEFPAGTWDGGFAPIVAQVDMCDAFAPPLLSEITTNPDGSGSFLVEDFCGEQFDFTFIAAGTEGP